MTRLELNRIDLKILEALQKRWRIFNNDLAKLVSLSPSACLARLRTLEVSHVIVGYETRIALEQVRNVMEVYAEVTMGQYLTTVFRNFEAVLSSIPEIVEVVRVSGPFDYLLKVVVSDVNEWKDISQGFLNDENGVVKLALSRMLWLISPRFLPKRERAGKLQRWKPSSLEPSGSARRGAWPTSTFALLKA